MVHYDKYNMDLCMKDEDFLEHILGIRKLGRPRYTLAIGKNNKKRET
jgi:hypothetical protein